MALGEQRDEEEYKTLPPYIRLFIRLIIGQITILYHFLKKYDMLPRFEIVTYEYYLEQIGMEFRMAMEHEENIDEEDEDEDKEPPLQ